MSNMKWSHYNTGLYFVWYSYLIPYEYSGDMNSELGQYSNGWKQFGSQMVPYSGHGLNSTQPFDLNNELIVRYSSHDLNNEQKVCYSGHRLHD